MKSQQVLIVGGGAAGWSAAAELVAADWRGPVTVIDPEAPMNRTLVNKGVLTGLLTREQIVRAAPAGADVIRDEVTAVGDDGTVLLRSGDRMRPAAVVIASGSAPRPPSSGGDATGTAARIATLHSIADAERIRALLPATGGRVVILGAGLIGSETASLLAEAGRDVTLVSRSPAPLRGQLGPVVASALLRRHGERIRTRFGHPVARVTDGPRSVVVELEDGERLEADVALVVHGTVARRPGLLGERAGSIAVDDRLRAATPGVYAAGGVAAIASGGVSMRVDHWDDAAAQGAHAARSIVHDLLRGPDPGPYRFAAGYSSRIHGSTLTGWGVAFPGSHWDQPIDGAAVTVGSHDRRPTTVVGLDTAGAVRELARDIAAGLTYATSAERSPGTKERHVDSAPDLQHQLRDHLPALRAEGGTEEPHQGRGR